MSQNVPHSDGIASGSQVGSQRLSRPHWLYVNFRAFFYRLLVHARKVGRIVKSVWITIRWFLGVSPESSSHYRENFKVFLLRFLALAWKPKDFAPLFLDCLLLIQSTWSGRQLGPDVVYPLLSTGKRHSGRPGRMILEHCRNQRLFELHAKTAFPDGIDPPSVVVIDLNQVPRSVVENGYSTQVDICGLMCMLIFIEIITTLVVHVFYLPDILNMLSGLSVIVHFCRNAIVLGNGTLSLARRSDISAPGCAVLLDQDFTVVLNGSQSVVEAIAESSFNLSYPALAGGEEHGDSPYYTLEALGEGAWGTIFVLCWLSFSPSTLAGLWVPSLGFSIAAYAVFRYQQRRSFLLQRQWSWTIMKALFFRFLPVVYFGLWYSGMAILKTPLVALFWHVVVLILSSFLLSLFSVGFKARNYPIRPEKLLDALGKPHVRKWQFDTLAAAATFQCLVLCRGAARPIKTIDVSAFLNMLIPDQRDVWKAWKERVADRIVHETDILFTPTIPTFPDERQWQLKYLLDQAQFGDDTYRHLYIQGVPPDSTDRDDPPLSTSALVSFTACCSLLSTLFTSHVRRVLP